MGCFSLVFGKNIARPLGVKYVCSCHLNLPKKITKGKLDLLAAFGHKGSLESIEEE